MHGVDQIEGCLRHAATLFGTSTKILVRHLPPLVVAGAPAPAAVVTAVMDAGAAVVEAGEVVGAEIGASFGGFGSVGRSSQRATKAQ
jgi:hypothetical protein